MVFQYLFLCVILSSTVLGSIFWRKIDQVAHNYESDIEKKLFSWSVPGRRPVPFQDLFLNSEQ